jgi:hypothetical protein
MHRKRNYSWPLEHRPTDQTHCFVESGTDFLCGRCDGRWQGNLAVWMLATLSILFSRRRLRFIDVIDIVGERRIEHDT